MEHSQNPISGKLIKISREKFLFAVQETPLFAIEEKLHQKWASLRVLTTNGFGFFENFGYFWVHLDHHITFRCHIVVSSVLLNFHPLWELFLQDGGAYVGKPLLWYLRKFYGWLGQVMVHFRVWFIQKLPDLLHAHPVVSEYRTKLVREVLIIL